MVEKIVMKPGDEVTSWCTKCREMRQHNVVVFLPDNPEKKRYRVTCRTCSSEHYHRPDPPKSRRKKKKEELPNPWPQLIETADVSSARIYTIHDRFLEGETINHRKYGVGFVESILDVSKIVVAFEDKRRIMVCNK